MLHRAAFGVAFQKAAVRDNDRKAFRNDVQRARNFIEAAGAKLSLNTNCAVPLTAYALNGTLLRLRRDCEEMARFFFGAERQVGNRRILSEQSLNARRQVDRGGPLRVVAHG